MHFLKELNNATNRVQDAIAPYTRFVRAEQTKATAMQQQVGFLNTRVMKLKNAIENM